MIQLDAYASLIFLTIMEFHDNWVDSGKPLPGQFRRILDTKENRRLYNYNGASMRDYTPLGDSKPYFFVTLNNSKDEHREFAEQEIAFVYKAIAQEYGVEKAEEYLAADSNIKWSLENYGINPRKYID